MNTHKFDVGDAEKYGVKKAILLEHLKYHQESNSGNKDCIIDGKPHAFLRPETIKKMFPYFSYKSINRWLRELEDEGVIESCKPKRSSGKHLKYYHVKGHKLPNSQNEKSISQNESSARDTNRNARNAQNESSSIYNQCVIPSEGKPSLPERIKNCNTVKALSDIWFNYRKEKNRWPGLSEQEMLRHKMSQWGLGKSKKIVSKAIRNGWLSLKEEYISDQENKRSHFRPDAVHL